MKTPRRGVNPLSMRIISAFAVSLLANLTLHAQTDTTPINLADLQLVSSNQVPRNATFWLLSTFDQRRFGPPLPFNPFARLNPDIYSGPSNLFPEGATNSFIIDDLAIQEARAEN